VRGEVFEGGLAFKSFGDIHEHFFGGLIADVN